MNIQVVPALPGDFPLFNDIRCSAMQEHIERLHVFNKEKETEYNFLSFNIEQLRRIQLEDRIIGFINLRPADYSTISLGLFCIKKEYQNHGYGSRVLSLVLDSPPCEGVCVFLNVLKGSKAINLYHKFGFTYSHSDKISDYFKRLPKYEM